MSDQVMPETHSPEDIVGEARYHGDSKWAKIVQSKAFQNMGLAQTTMFLVWLGVDADNNAAENYAESAQIFIIIFAAFWMYFSIDAFLRFMALRRKNDLIKYCVALQLDIILALCLGLSLFVPMFSRWMPLQLLRVGRLANAIPELAILLKSLTAAIRACVWCVLLIIVACYSFGIIMKSFAPEELREQAFKTVPDAMYTMLVHGLFLDNAENISEIIKRERPALIPAWFLFLLGIFFLLMLTIAVAFDIASEVVADEKEQLMASYMADCLKSQTQVHMWTSSEAFIEALYDEKVVDSLKHLSIDAHELIFYSQLIFAGPSYQSMKELAREMLKFSRKSSSRAKITYRDLAPFLRKIEVS
eukprot:TRINITY_DN4227_c6_g1_i1.p1 TRINITY_DN4227_c6_g1~~TRINITY_DN4227_c6_g1_i1.p1  ORF type:complete len:360 (-),score=54.74 TRINITY_DN4227_c6_g1_i1:141-1220(-)